MTEVRLTGRLVCRDDDEADIVAAHVSRHVELTRAEPGCLAFEVDPAEEPREWLVVERFADAAALREHQSRTAASEWGRATTGIERRYLVEGL